MHASMYGTTSLFMHTLDMPVSPSPCPPRKSVWRSATALSLDLIYSLASHPRLTRLSPGKSHRITLLISPSPPLHFSAEMLPSLSNIRPQENKRKMKTFGSLGWGGFSYILLGKKERTWKWEREREKPGIPVGYLCDKETVLNFLLFLTQKPVLCSHCLTELHASSSVTAPPSLKSTMTFTKTIFSHTFRHTPGTLECGETECVSTGQVFLFYCPWGRLRTPF